MACTCAAPHHAWCHAHPAAARAAGLIVPSTGDPATAPVWLHPATAWPAWWLLDPEGIYIGVDTDQPAPVPYPTRRSA